MTQKAALRHFVKCLDGQRVPLNSSQRAETPGEYPYWGANGVVDTVGDFLFDEELVLLGEDGAPFDDPLRDVAFRVTERVWVNNHIHVLRPRVGTDPRFLTYALNSVDWMPLVSGSTRYKLTRDDMMRARIPYVPLNAQRAIADYLDSETNRIDTLITKKRRMIQLLHERRAALISRAVTRGVNSAPLLKPAGIEWLREMPDHWSVGRLADIANLMNGHPFDSDLFHRSDGIPLVRIRDLFTRTTSVNWSGDPVPGAEIVSGDILIGMDGDFNVAWWDQGNALLNQRLCCLRAIPDHALQKFLFYYIPFPLKLLNDITYSTTVKHLSSRDVLKFRLPLPPLEEQQNIVNYLDAETTRIDTLTYMMHSMIGLLSERRETLIAATVTGELPVPDVAA